MSHPANPSAGSPGRTDTLRGILWMLLAVAGLAVVMLSVRGLRADMHALQVLFLRAFLLWGETFSPWTALGAAIIFGSQYHAVRRAAGSG